MNEDKEKSKLGENILFLESASLTTKADLLEAARLFAAYSLIGENIRSLTEMYMAQLSPANLVRMQEALDNIALQRARLINSNL